MSPHDLFVATYIPPTRISISIHVSLSQSGIAHVSMDSDSLQFGCVPPHCVSDGKVSVQTKHYIIHI